ncbi:minor capsid protein [Solibacillus cecembensis]|uniref:minor capsid protein n=1 Tax=Solibacillus cecembensis TaxID=459347 RepID=UPI003D005C57
MKQRSNSYWDKRSMECMTEYHRSADATVKTVNKAYDKAQKDIQFEIDKIFETFGTNGQLSPSEAKKILNQRIPNPLLGVAKKIYLNIKDKRIKRWLLTRMNAPTYRARITRLEALKENAYLQSKIIADAEIQASTAGYMKIIRDTYYRTMYDVHRGLGVGFEFAAMPESNIESILKNPWSGKHFSERVWDNTDTLASQISEVITAGFMSGTSTRKMIQDLAERMGVGKFAASRLIRTETTYMANAAEMESYKEAEVDEYMFLATLDMRTSPQCQEQDKEVYKVKDAKPGVNMPPMHVFCRSTTRAYFGAQTLKNIQRRVRNPITGKNELIPANMAYPEWRKKYSNAG